MATDPRDYKLDITGLSTPGPTPPRKPRPWLSVLFRCCGVYQRVYRHRDGARYEGYCPRCAARVSFAVGSGGTSARQFIAG